MRAAHIPGIENQTMNRVELIEHIAGQHGLSKAEAGRVLATVLDAVVTTVKKGGTVTLPGFGSFKQTARAARTGRNPATGDKIKIAAAKLPKFAAGAARQAAGAPHAPPRPAAAPAAPPPHPPHKAAHGKKA